MFSEFLQIDPKSIFQLYIWCNLFICILLGSYYFSYATDENKDTLKWFGLSKCLLPLSLFLTFCSFIPGEIVFDLSITSFLTAAYLESITMLRLLKSVSKKIYRLQLCIALMSIVIFNLLQFTGANFAEVTAVYSLGIFVIFLIPIVKFISEKNHNFFHFIYVLAYFAFCMSITVRGIHVFLVPSQKMFVIDAYDIVFYLSLYLHMLVGTVGFLLLLKEKKDMHIQRLLSDKDQFLSIISHDLRAPLNSALIMTGILHEKFNQFSPEKVKDYLQIIHQGNQRNLKLLQDLVNWSQVRGGLMEFNPQKLDLDKLIQEKLELNKQLVIDKNIVLKFHCVEPVEVLADKNMMDTIIRNLISNAVKFNKINGNIDVQVVKNNQEVEISIADTGMGMDKETKEKLFKFSEKASKNGTEKEIGTGLGLLLCNEFVKRHNGRIWMESELGKGSTFRFTLPLN